MSLEFSVSSGIVFMIAISILSVYTIKKDTNNISTFFYGDGNLKIPSIVNLLLSTSFSMNGVLYQTYLGYKFGWAALIVQFFWCLSFILLSLVSKKIIQYEKYGTIHGTITNFFGSTTGKVASIATIVGFTLQIGWELIVGSYAISVVTENKGTLLIILVFGLAIISALYTILGGLKSNISANFIQNAAAISAFVIIPLFLSINTNNINWKYIDISGIMSVNLKIKGTEFFTSNKDFFLFIANIIFSILWQFVDMSTWHTVITSEKKESKSSLFFSSIWIFLFPGLFGTILGIIISYQAGIPDNELLPYIIKQTYNIDNIGSYLVFLFIFGCIGAMLSTLDGLLLAVGQVVSWDWINKNEITKIFNNEYSQDERVRAEKSIIKTTRIIVVLDAILGSLLAYVITQIWGVSIFDIVFIVTISQLILTPLIYIILFKKHQKYTNGAWGILFSFILGIFLVLYGIGFNKDILPIIPVLSLLISILLTLIFVRKNR